MWEALELPSTHNPVRCWSSGTLGNIKLAGKTIRNNQRGRQWSWSRSNAPFPSLLKSPHYLPYFAKHRHNTNPSENLSFCGLFSVAHSFFFFFSVEKLRLQNTVSNQYWKLKNCNTACSKKNVLVFKWHLITCYQNVAAMDSCVHNWNYRWQQKLEDDQADMAYH